MNQILALIGDRVQWFRAEAEMQCWQEEWELKKAEFLCCIRHFIKMADVWNNLTKSNQSNGSAAYARKKAAMYEEMARDARNQFNKAGYSHLNIDNSNSLADHCKEERMKPENHIPVTYGGGDEDSCSAESEVCL